MLGKDGRCALCKRSSGHAARRPGWTAVLAAVACALAGAAIVGARVVVAGLSDDTRAPVATTRPLLPRRAPATERADVTSASSRTGARPEPRAAREPPEPNTGVETITSAEPGDVSAEDRVLKAPAGAPEASRYPVPAAPDAPEPARDLESVPAPDDPRDFERPAEPANLAPWSPPL